MIPERSLGSVARWARSGLAVSFYACAMAACSCGTEMVGDEDAGLIPGFDASQPDAGPDERMDASSGLDAGDSAVGPDGGAEPGPDGGPELPRECLAEEACDDGLDDDCDGAVDEGCACAPGDTASCFTGDPRDRGRGACRDGTMICVGDVEFGQWGPCEGDAVASEEMCDAAGVDEDCDGAPNDGCECAEGDPDLPCGTDTGECSTGVQRCVAGVRTHCEGSIGPTVERCNGLDDDCDSMVDESITRPCGIDEGVCRRGAERCADGVFGACEGGAGPSDERCDGLDEDCDGMVDENVTRLCGTDEGRCVAGLQACEDGTFATCEGRVSAIAETCNDVDDDCDGTIDEALSRACGTDVGACVAGTETCTAGVWGTCGGAVTGSDEVCDGVEDDDCDGTVDEGCLCTEGQTRPCGTDEGECTAGTQTCSAEGSWGSCEGAVAPGTETCDGTDDDCDGMLDEGCDCITGQTRSCGTDVGECSAGLETCDEAGRWGPCADAVEASDELCNGRDDDCDAMIDEGDVCPRFPPSVTCPGAESTPVGEAVELTASGSDPDGGAVTYAWTVVSRPSPGSTAEPSPADAAATTFTPDAAGDFTLRFCATDDEGEVRCCTVTVSATSACDPPLAPALSVCPTSWDRRPVVQFDPLPAGVTYDLFLDAEVAPYATVTMEGQNYHRPGSELGPGAAPPGATRSIFARACLVSDPSCCSASEAVEVSLIEQCTTPVAPTASNIVFSEYVVNGDGDCPGEDCEAGEAIEITNLSHCPVSLDDHHFAYCNPSSCGTFRWMDFGPEDVIPPRGVYVAIRNQSASMCDYPFFGPDDPGLFGLRISRLDMQGQYLSSGWFQNDGDGMSRLRIATGPWSSIDGGTTLELISPYSGAAGECESIGFDAIGECGQISSVASPSEVLTPNQLGRLWHPCDAVTAPVPASCM